MSASDPSDRTIGALRAGCRPYPYLVIRWMAALYGTFEIQIVGDEGSGGDRDARGLTIVEPEYREGDTMTTALRRRILEAVLVRCQRERRRMCVVFGEGDSVYVEPDGRTHGADDPPRGGLLLDEQ